MRSILAAFIVACLVLGGCRNLTNEVGEGVERYRADIDWSGRRLNVDSESQGRTSGITTQVPVREAAERLLDSFVRDPDSQPQPLSDKGPPRSRVHIDEAWIVAVYGICDVRRQPIVQLEPSEAFLCLLTGSDWGLAVALRPNPETGTWQYVPLVMAPDPIRILAEVAPDAGTCQVILANDEVDGGVDWLASVLEGQQVEVTPIWFPPLGTWTAGRFVLRYGERYPLDVLAFDPRLR